MSDNALSALDALDNLTIEDLDGATKQRGFRVATLQLMLGNITVPTWEWHAEQAINTAVDIPLIGEETEETLFSSGLMAVGAVLESGISRGFPSTELRDATLDLLQGDTTVPEWTDAASEALDEAIDLPYVPEFAEDMIFDRGVDLAAKTLHGLLKDGSGDGSGEGGEEGQ